MVKEYFTEAVVLDKESLGELDARVSLYTQIAGKIFAKVKSARKINSKLSPHLEPLNLVKARIVQKNGLQIADVVKFGKLGAENIRILKLISGTVLEGAPDYHLWSLVKSGTILPEQILKVLGFDPEFSLCVKCQGEKPEFFIFNDAVYICRKCFLGKPDKKEYLELNR